MTILRLAITLALAGLLLFSAVASAEEPQLPCRFHGTAEVNGRPVEVGTVITAEIQGDSFTTTTSALDGNSTYAIEIVPPEGKQYAPCIDILFTVGNYAANEVGRFASGGNFALDLTAFRAQLPNVFFGTVEVNGEPVEEGTDVKALVGGETHRTKTTGNSTYELKIAPEEGEEYREGAPITFIIGTLLTAETAKFEPGSESELDLTAQGDVGSASIMPTIALLLLVAVAVVTLSPLRRRISQRPTARTAMWLAVAGCIIAAFWLLSRFEWTWDDFPTDQFVPLDDWVNNAVVWLTDNLNPFFDAINTAILKPLVAIRDFLKWLPWWAVLLIFGTIAWRIAGLGIAALAVVGLFFIGTLGHETQGAGTDGFWDLTMITVSIMIVAVMVSLLIGIPIGIIAGRSDRFEAAIRPILDAMQTMPSFVYLVPAVIFFGLGMVPAVIATVIYSISPCIRLTNLGIRQVSSEVVEAGKAFGSTPRQLLFKIQLPLAMPSIMAGVTQTVMLALAMVVIGSMIGASGLGLEVLRGIQQVDTGRAFTAGLGIVIIAIILDRVSQNVGKGGPRKQRQSRRFLGILTRGQDISGGAHHKDE
ncbi:ABC transporter permease [Chloroflexota bacterium]